MIANQSSSTTFCTGLPALDERIIPDGIPLRSLNVIGGGPGTGKTVLALQMLFANASPQNRAVYFTTISEPTIKFLSYLQEFDFYDPDKIFTSIVVRDIGDVIQTQPLPEVIQTINRIIAQENARLVVIDSFKAISDIVPQAELLRVFAYNLAVNLVSANCTSFLVGEYTLEDISQVPIFAIADGIVNLSFQAEGLNRQRYLEMHKLRGRTFVQGLHPFTISRAGITIYPRVRTPERFEDYAVSEGRVSIGVPSLDGMLDGGLTAGTATLVAGSAGVGKTLMGLHFITEGAKNQEPGVIVTFQEDPVQLRKIARGFGWDLQTLVERGQLVHLYSSPVELQPDVHTTHVRRAVERIGAQRVLIDSLKDLEIATSNKVRYKDYVYTLVSGFKRQGITTLLTSEIPELFGSFNLSDFGISFIADNVILLRYVEMGGRVGRACNVLKMRGSQHVKAIHEFEITDRGIGIGEPLRAMAGVLTGTPVVSTNLGWRQLEPKEQYVLEVLQANGPIALSEVAAQTQIPAQTLDTLLRDLAERGYVLAYGQGDRKKYKVAR